MLCVGDCGGFVRKEQASPFRHRAWRAFEHALDLLGAPRALAEAKPSHERDRAGFKDSGPS